MDLTRGFPVIGRFPPLRIQRVATYDLPGLGYPLFLLVFAMCSLFEGLLPIKVNQGGCLIGSRVCSLTCICFTCFISPLLRVCDMLVVSIEPITIGQWFMLFSRLKQMEGFRSNLLSVTVFGMCFSCFCLVSIRSRGLQQNHQLFRKSIPIESRFFQAHLQQTSNNPPTNLSSIPMKICSIRCPVRKRYGGSLERRSRNVDPGSISPCLLI